MDRGRVIRISSLNIRLVQWVGGSASSTTARRCQDSCPTEYEADQGDHHVLQCGLQVMGNGVGD